MRLLIDIGNTRLKWALLSDGKLSQQHAFVYQQAILAEQLTRKWAQLTAPKGIYVVSVATTQIVQDVTDWSKKRWACPVEVIQSGMRCGEVINGYTKPECLGVDRWAAIVAAYGIVGSAVCVIDCGTAVTCDMVDSHGNHLGGVIVPGQEMMRSALMESTAGIQVRASSRIATLWGRDTTSCIEAGGLQASVALIERMVLQMQRQLDEPVMAVLTGGDAESLLPWLSIPCRYEENLVLQGLVRIAMEQRI